MQRVREHGEGDRRMKTLIGLLAVVMTQGCAVFDVRPPVRDRIAWVQHESRTPHEVAYVGIWGYIPNANSYIAPGSPRFPGGWRVKSYRDVVTYEIVIFDLLTGDELSRTDDRKAQRYRRRHGVERD